MKRCSKCGIEKDESEFHKNKNTKDGLSNYCKSCKYIIDRNSNRRHSSEIKIRQREYRRNMGAKQRISEIHDTTILNEALNMKLHNMSIPEISRELSYKYDLNVTQVSIVRAFKSRQGIKAFNNIFSVHNPLLDFDYPSRKEIENLFSELLQKENNFICIYGGERLKRNLMIRFLNAYIYQEFTYTDARINLNKWVSESGFYQHWDYLLKGNYIIKTENGNFKFCDRVKKWKNFGQV